MPLTAPVTPTPRRPDRLSRAAARVPTSTIRDLLALVGSDDVLSLAGGLPALGAVHDPLLAQIAAEVTDDAAHLQYSPTEGSPALRRWIVDLLDREAGDPPAALDGVRITHGSQQAIDLAVRTLVDPGDVVVVERPTYLGAVQALAPADARIHAVPIDDDGLDTDRLDAALRRGLRPVLCYLAPTFQNPSGVVMSADRRAHLGTLADRYGFVVLDDDPYRDLGFGAPPPRLRRWVPPEWSVTVGTFSKVLAPGLRVGWCHGPAWLTAPLTRMKQATDLHTSTLAQEVVATAVSRPGWLDRRVEQLVSLYRHRAGVLSEALRRLAPGRLEHADARGGMFLWARLSGHADAAALLPHALARGVAFVPGAAFLCDGEPSDRLRLCFATLDDALLVEAAARLVGAVDDLAAADRRGGRARRSAMMGHAPARDSAPA